MKEAREKQAELAEWIEVRTRCWKRIVRDCDIKDRRGLAMTFK